MKENIYELLIRSYIDSFLESSSYHQLVRSGRVSMAVIADSLKPNPKFTPLKDSKSNKIDRNSNEIKSNNLKEFRHFILSEHNYHLGTYLQKYQQNNKLHFCQSTLRFKEANFPADIERINEAGSIFERSYIHTYIHAYIRTYMHIHTYTYICHLYIMHLKYTLTFIFLFRYLSRKTEEQVVLPEAIRKKIMQGLFNAPQVILTFSYYMHPLYYILYNIFV